MKPTEQKKDSKLVHYHVSAAVIRREDKILITQRSFSDKHGGLWEFPGGKQKKGESLERCLVREIAEELNVPVQFDKKFMRVTHRYDHIQITLHVFLCTLNDGIPESREVQDWRWIDLQDIDQYDFTEADQKVIQNLLTSKEIF